MGKAKRILLRFWSLLLCGITLGCTQLPWTGAVAEPSPASPVAGVEETAGTTQPPSGIEVLLSVPDPPPELVPLPKVLPAAIDILSADWLVEQVLARNPSLAQMIAAWQAAAARYPQVTSLDDPMFGTTVGPGSIGSNEVDFAYRLEVGQKFPFPGKLRLRGETAQAEASAAGRDVADVQLQLIESAQHAFSEYYLVDRALAVNEEALRLLKEFKGNAETRYKAGQVPQQDVLQADVEVGRAQERQLNLERMRRVAVARINTLMHLPTHAPLPPPPGEIPVVGELAPVEALQAAALARRPDLQALTDRLAAEEAALLLARREYYPDFEVMAAYDAFWQPRERDLRPMLGVRVNLPIRQARRQGAIAEAEYRLGQRRAELERQTDQVNFQVEEAHAQVRESERIARLYQQTILPAADANVKAAQTAYTTGKVPFLTLIEAQRNLIGLRDRYYETQADFFRRKATLERVVGGSLDALRIRQCP